LKILEKTFKTPLGIVHCGLQSGVSDIVQIESTIYKNGKSEILKTGAHQIEIIEFKLNHEVTVADSSAWIWRIEKTNELTEIIETYCFFEKGDTNVELDSANGEHLDAIEIYNNDWTLHIGTEDGDMMHNRATADDWLPIRLAANIDISHPITLAQENGFSTIIPDLKKGEQIHIQYLSAYDKRDIDKINTWLAVDRSKNELELWLRIR